MLQPGVPVCIVTHGSLVSWDDLMMESPRVYQWLKCAAPDKPLQVVFFTWPSNDLPLGFCPQIDFGILGRRAEYNGLYLSQLVTQVPSACPISFFGHSYGTRTIAATLHLFGGGDVLGYRLNHSCGIGHRVRTVFAASAIDHHWLNPGDRFGRALGQTEALLVTLNERDLALHFYDIRSLWGHTALGDEGFHRSDLRAIGWQAAKLSTLDVAPLLGCGHTWYHFYTHPQIAWSIGPWIFMGEPSLPCDSVPPGQYLESLSPAAPPLDPPPVETVPPLDFE